ncbi:shikimate kinase [Chlamydia muridarum str. Nigg 2 MCR]|uniref:Shikimate kinase n=1 Tax=Chlamydia muridarum TaxID=83560 RepID=A0A0C5X5E2_CHLMR|nr:shikimate kinase [Chlamydia muridarum str. Nigg3 CMUT3-5]AHH23957.1 shikimate kinase [Chlamydia muridarum str. Nigg CM972]AID38164.1 shikimate kinase [Chlamydia muridarum str. Nigg 2 MCR]AJR10717.1 shikimate kinase [Chlamydia muridarum]
MFLCGLPSVGKTSFGRLLAQFLSLPFFDTDHLLSARFHGDSPKAIYQRFGEEGFCQEELLTLINLPVIPSVVALGGKTLLDKQIYEHITQRENILLVLLDLPFATLYQRLQKKPLPESLKNTPSLENALFQRLEKLRLLTPHIFSLQAATSLHEIGEVCQSFCLQFLTAQEIPYA